MSSLPLYKCTSVDMYDVSLFLLFSDAALYVPLQGAILYVILIVISSPVSCDHKSASGHKPT